MNFNFIASFVAALALLSIIIRRSKKRDEKPIESYLEREQKANSTRKKSLDSLAYISIPEDILSMKPNNTTEEIEAYIKDLNDLSTEKIVNLTGISNTDLKLTYGTANITVLSQYDFNYTNMVTILQKLASCLANAGEKELAVSVLEFAISTNSDISKSYMLLASLYRETGHTEKIDTLINQAQNLNTMMKDSIVHNLKASGQ